MQIIRGRPENSPSQRRSETFTGTVWMDPVLPKADGVMVNNVFFAPGARTHWHRHEHGQILHVTAGSGLICTQGGVPRRLHVGDMVWIPPGEVHWHGGSPDSYLLHLAVSLGETGWLDPVTDAEYSADLR